MPLYEHQGDDGDRFAFMGKNTPGLGAVDELFPPQAKFACGAELGKC